MNSFRRTIAAVVVAAGLFGYIAFVESKKDPKEDSGSSTSAKREKVFVGLDKLKVKSITLKQRDGELVHVEKIAEAWVLTSPQETAADAGEIATLLDAMQNLETDDVVPDNTALSPYGLESPKVSVSIVAEGAARPFEFELGDSVPAGSGLFARVPGQARLLVVSATLENTLSKSAFDLRDRSLLKLERDEIQSVETTEKGRVLFRLTRGAVGEDEWKIEAPARTRAARWPVESFLGLVENLRMESIATEVATPADLARYGLTERARQVVLGLGEAKSLTLEIGSKAEENKYYARVASSKLVATISSGLVDDLDKGLKNLRATRLLDVAVYEVSGFDVLSAGVTRTFTKSTTKGKDGIDLIEWKSTAPVSTATQEKTADALSAIGTLDSAEFIDSPKALSSYGLDTPALRVTVHFEGNKKQDWFEVAIKGQDAYARRRDDDAVIKLDRTKTEALLKNFTSLGS